ncbi:hypothetical protein SAMD00079811_83030 (plasmid) [Scytonema sp. HK-05]|nr:hypothetical protein SAMD00079811_83030 [Scytonema sp. HK-05]
MYFLFLSAAVALWIPLTTKYAPITPPSKGVVTLAIAVPATKPITKVSAALSSSAVLQASADQSIASLCRLSGLNRVMLGISQINLCLCPPVRRLEGVFISIGFDSFVLCDKSTQACLPTAAGSNQSQNQTV